MSWGKKSRVYYSGGPLRCLKASLSLNSFGKWTCLCLPKTGVRNSHSIAAHRKIHIALTCDSLQASYIVQQGENPLNSHKRICIYTCLLLKKNTQLFILMLHIMLQFEQNSLSITSLSLILPTLLTGGKTGPGVMRPPWTKATWDRCLQKGENWEWTSRRTGRIDPLSFARCEGKQTCHYKHI